jgi:hypothetical protein
MRIIDYFFISVTEGVICKIKMKTFGSEREIQAYTNLMENRLLGIVLRQKDMIQRRPLACC